MVRDLERTWLESWWQRTLERRHVDRHLWMGKKETIFFTWVSTVHERVTLAEEDFNNQVHRMTYSADNFSEDISRFPQPLLSSPNRLMNKLSRVAGIKQVMYGLSNWTSIHQGQPGYGHLWMPNLPAVENKTVPDIKPFSGGSSSYLVAGLSHWTASIMEEKHFVLTEINTDTGYRFAFLTSNVSAKTTTYMCMYICMYSHTHTNKIIKSVNSLVHV